MPSIVQKTIYNSKGEKKMAGNFADARVDRILREAGAERVSADAVEKMNEILTDHGREVAKFAIEIAGHAGRKTVKGEDIKLAMDR